MRIYSDYDGPIISIKNKCWQVHLKVIKELGGTVHGTIGQYWAQKRKFVNRKTILKQCELDASHEADYVALFTAYVETEDYLQFDSLVPGVIETLEKLTSEHELVLVTVRKNSISALKQIDDLGLRKYFSKLLIGREKIDESGGEAKARMILEELNNSDILGDLIVGDSSHEIVAGKLLHIPSIAVLNGIRGKAYLASFKPTYMIKDFNALPELLKSKFI